jgi:hypothetical protein
MRALRSAAVLAAALSTLFVAPAVAPADAAPIGRLVADPVAGDCHALTYDESMKGSDPDPTVPCTDAHTSITVKVVQLTNPDWSDMNEVGRQITAPCRKAWFEELGGVKKASLSAYGLFWFVPTKAQRDAGASWVRCDAALYGSKSLLPLPSGTDISLGSLPLSDKLARCRAGKRADYRMLSCSKGHAFHATLALKYPGSSFPGERAAARWALRHCRAHISTAFYYEAVPSKASWKQGYRYAVCLPKTRS